MGRPRKMIDEATLEGLAAIGCTVEEMAGVLGCAKAVLERRYSSIIEKGRSRGKQTLRRTQWHAAMGDPEKGIAPNVAMLIWLGKQMLGQREPVTHALEGPGWSRVADQRAEVGLIIHDPEARGHARQLQARLTALLAAKRMAKAGADGNGDGNGNGSGRADSEDQGEQPAQGDAGPVAG